METCICAATLWIVAEPTGATLTSWSQAGVRPGVAVNAAPTEAREHRDPELGRDQNSDQTTGKKMASIFLNASLLLNATAASKTQ